MYSIQYALCTIVYVQWQWDQDGTHTHIEQTSMAHGCKALYCLDPSFWNASLPKSGALLALLGWDPQKAHAPWQITVLSSSDSRLCQGKIARVSDSGEMWGGKPSSRSCQASSASQLVSQRRPSLTIGNHPDKSLPRLWVASDNLLLAHARLVQPIHHWGVPA